MARQPMVTRTIITTNAKVLCLDIDKQEPFERIVKLPRTDKDERKMMKKIEAVVNNDSVKAVHVISTETEEILYGMTEQKFIEEAEILPSR